MGNDAKQMLKDLARHQLVDGKAHALGVVAGELGDVGVADGIGRHAVQVRSECGERCG